jgi:hypothetical protein
MPPAAAARRTASAHEPVHGPTRRYLETAGGAPGGRTLNQRIKRSTLSRNVCLTCTNASRGCHERTRGTGSSSGAGPRPGPRRDPHQRRSRLLSVSSQRWKPSDVLPTYPVVSSTCMTTEPGVHHPRPRPATRRALYTGRPTGPALSGCPAPLVPPLVPPLALGELPVQVQGGPAGPLAPPTRRARLRSCLPRPLRQRQRRAAGARRDTVGPGGAVQESDTGSSAGGCPCSRCRIVRGRAEPVKSACGVGFADLRLLTEPAQPRIGLRSKAWDGSSQELGRWCSGRPAVRRRAERAHPARRRFTSRAAGAW